MWSSSLALKVQQSQQTLIQIPASAGKQEWKGLGGKDGQALYPSLTQEQHSEKYKMPVWLQR